MSDNDPHRPRAQSRPIRALYINDNTGGRELVQGALDHSERSFELREASSPEELGGFAAAGGFDLVLCDLDMAGFEGLEVLEAVKDKAPGLPVVVIAGAGSEQTAVLALGRGAEEYVIKTPPRIERLPRALAGVFEKRLHEKERRRKEEELRRTKEQMELIIEHNVDGMLVLDQKGEILFANQAGAELLGRERDALVGAALGVPLAGQDPPEMEIIREDGEIHYVELRTADIDWAGEKCALASLRDVTEKRRALERSRRLNRILEAIRSVNQLIVQEKDVDALLDKVCKALVETRGYGKAWIVLLDGDGAVKSFAGSGLSGRGPDLVEMIREGPPPCARKVFDAETAEVLAIHDSDILCAECPLEKAYQRGDVMACSLATDVSSRGAAVVCLPKGMPADEYERGLFSEVAGDIAFALRDIELTEAHARTEAALREAKESLEEAQELAGVGSWFYDIAADKPVWTRQSFNIFGVDPNEGEPDWEGHRRLIHHDDWARIDRAVKDAISYGKPYSEEFRIVRPGGEVVWAHTRGVAVKDASGGIAYLKGTVQDISEMRSIELDLAERERRFRLIAETIDDVFWISTPGVEQNVYVSPAYEKIWGRPREEFESNPMAFLDSIHPDDRDQYLECVMENHKAAVPYSAQYRIVRPDGEIRWIHERGYRGDAHAEFGPLMAGVCSDVTEKVLSDLARDKSERLLVEAENLSNIGAWEWDIEGDNFSLSDGWVRIHGFSGREADRETLFKLLHPEDAGLVEREMREIVQGKKNEYSLEHRIVRADNGEVRYVAAHGGLVVREDGSRFIYGTSQDITERKLAERELLKFEWLLEKEHSGGAREKESYRPPYGDLTRLNTARLILDSVGRDTLQTLARDLVDLLDTSVAVYEKNGDYAYGHFESDWCRLMDRASFELCGTGGGKEALNSGKWLCHENCWNDSAKAAIETGAPTDIACVGGIRLYAAPIWAGGEVIGAVNIGYGSPPLEDETANRLAELFKVDPETIKREARGYKPRPDFIIEVAKRRCLSTARMIGETVERRLAEQMREASEKRFRALFENSLAPILIADDEGGYLDANSAACELLGYGRERLLGMKVADLVSAMDLSSGEQYEEYRRSGGGKGVFSFIGGDGEEKTALWSAAEISEGEHASVLQDITELKRYERKLVAERNKAKLYLDTAAVALLGLDREGRITLINNCGAEMLGMGDKDSLIGQDWFQFIPPGDRELVRGIHDAIISGETEMNRLVEGKVLTKGGDLREIHWNNSTLRDQDGAIIGTLSSGEDVTELRQAERDLEKALLRERMALKGSNVGLFDWDIEDNEVYYSPEWLKQIGYDEGELPANFDTWESRLHPDDKDRVGKMLEDYLAARFDVYRTEFRLRHRDGSYRWIMVLGEAQWDEEGKPCRMTGCHVDITDQKRELEEKSMLEEQLKQAQRMEAVGRLAGGVAHDFNNALTPLLMISSEIINHLPNSHPLREDIKEIRESGERCVSLTRQLLAFSRKQTLDLAELDINEVIANIKRMLARIIGEDIEIVLNLDAGAGIVTADVGQLEQIIVNLAVNARDAMPNGGRLLIETEKIIFDEERARLHGDLGPGEYALVSVSDTGEGMDAETVERIFEPFFTTKEQGRGTGLGLSTVYGIVKQSNGHIDCRSEPGQGAAFRIFLPSASKKAAEKPAREIRGEQNLEGIETVLLVEDDEGVRKAAGRILAGNGYEVLVADNGPAAVELCDNYEGAIDLMITDVVMPGMSGGEVAELIAPRYPEMKVIYISGYTDDAIVERGVLQKGINFVEKPFTQKTLLAKVRSVMDA